MAWIEEITKEITPQFFNTETRRKEPLKLAQPGQVTLYTCGPTVYSYAHIGNFRAYVFEDLLKRTLQFFGLAVKHVMNITDVDDKTIRGAIAEQVPLNAYTDPFKVAFFDDLKTLMIDPADHYPAATDYIPQMVEMIEKLLEKEVAYKGTDGSIYYSITKFPHYGRLSHLKLDELEAGASQRVASDEYDKESASDFVLWKAYDPERDGAIFWESSLGPGRPGWHLECSAMAIALLGESIDIHAGGVDNIFPHHENEIAQSEACTGKCFARHWMHCEHLIVDGKKMSKSLGNFYTFRDLLDKGYRGRDVRYMLLHTHYRSQLNFSFQELEGIPHSLDRFDAFVRRLRAVDQEAAPGLLAGKTHLALRSFAQALADDLNISQALGVLFDWLREGNTLLDEGMVSKIDADQALELLHAINGVLGVLSFEEEAIPSEVEQMAQERLQARLNKDWQLADVLRDKIAALGYVVEDTASGPRIVRQK